MSYIGNNPADIGVYAVQSETGNGVLTAFTLDRAATTASILVSIDGVDQIPTTAYAVTVGTTLTFTSPPPNTSVISIRFLGDTVSFGEPSAGAVTNAHIDASAAIAQSKLVNIVDADIDASAAIGASKLASTLDLSSKTVTLPAASVTTHVTAFDDSAVRNDIATLALHSAIADNKAAYNLSNAFIDQYEDDTGIDTETTCDRDTGDEYMASVIPGPANDSNTLLLISSDTTDGSTTFADTSGGSTTHSIDSVLGSTHHETDQKKFGSTSIWINETTNAAGGVRLTAHGDYAFGNNDFSMDCWVYPVDTMTTNGAVWGTSNQSSWTTDGWYWGVREYSGPKLSWGYNGAHNEEVAITFPSDTWHHLAFVKQSGTGRLYLNGVQKHSFSNSNSLGNSGFKTVIGAYEPGGSESFMGYIDEFRISDNVRYPDGTTFTPPSVKYGGATVNAAGNYTSATQTALASVSTMGIVVLYKNQAGTATLNTDLVAQVSANGGTNYSSATLVAGGTFSSGINIAAVSGVSVTAGTTPKYKISFANQANGSKETRVYGVALLY